MSSLLSFTTAGDFTVASVEAEIDLSNATQLFDELLRSVDPSTRGLVVDFSPVRYVDSAGVQSLFDLARELQISRQHLGLVLPAESPLRRLVTITRLDDVATVGASVDSCLRALQNVTRPAS